VRFRNPLNGRERASTFSLQLAQRQPRHKPYFCQIQSAGYMWPPHFRQTFVPDSPLQRGLVGSCFWRGRSGRRPLCRRGRPPSTLGPAAFPARDLGFCGLPPPGCLMEHLALAAHESRMSGICRPSPRPHSKPPRASSNAGPPCSAPARRVPAPRVRPGSSAPRVPLRAGPRRPTPAGPRARGLGSGPRLRMCRRISGTVHW